MQLVATPLDGAVVFVAIGHGRRRQGEVRVVVDQPVLVVAIAVDLAASSVGFPLALVLDRLCVVLVVVKVEDRQPLELLEGGLANVFAFGKQFIYSRRSTISQPLP